jgi:hypothetical protein
MMQFKALMAAICLVATPVMSWMIPEGQADGVYVVTSHQNGTLLHSKIGEIPSGPTLPSKAPLSRVMKRDYGLTETYCAPNQSADLDHGNTDLANAALANGCGEGKTLSAAHGVYAQFGDVAAFFCNNKIGYDNVCIGEVHKVAQGMVTARCGWYRGGWAYDNGAHVSYGYQYATNPLCDHISPI